MSTRKVYSAQPYREDQLIDQSNFFRLNPGLEPIFSFINIFDKWEPYQIYLGNLEPVVPGYVAFLIHQYELCGATYGIMLNISISGWSLWSYEDSGYSKGKMILISNDFNLLGTTLTGFSPLRYTFD